MKKILLFLIPLSFLAGTAYHSGRPWDNKRQQIPGRVECEYYDLGGEGVAYHDSDSINNGSGKLNPANGDFLNEFRLHEGVDISFTKSKGIDDHSFNKTEPGLSKLYVGWTQPGEWINYTVEVKETGTYRVTLKYTANGDGTIAMDVDGKPAAKDFRVTSTHDDRDTVAWRQWHHWNKADPLGEIKLQKGIHVLRLHVVEHGNMNFDYLEFTRI